MPRGEPDPVDLRQGLQGARAHAFAQSLFANGVGLTKFTDPLPGWDPPAYRWRPPTAPHLWALGKATHYTIDIGEDKQGGPSDVVTGYNPA